MKWRITAALAGAAAVAATIGFADSANAATAPCSTQAKACVQLHTGRAWLMDNGKVVRGGVPITVGKPAYPTPAGTFHVQYKDIDHYSKQFNGPMPYSVFFTTTGVAFHQGSLKVQSHGCVHLSHADAVAFYNALHPGDVVEVVK
ncbi:L,D-transpeptidase [Amycolatopsis sp. DSM 110486]|uniref:L,D-transpeptidase n=1 Tax=Amycolatopsis sp. DSM 110486 TaxID=2865832 RepID=UPI001C69E827|nr:L,D-transpeptidase [Amycolatopsis sp. DSM 110486]QYN19464.1 L,D-transpeptidase [Amycolatopsis sp. DSM 110486]